MKKVLMLASCFVLLLCVGWAPASAQPAWEVEKIFHIGAPGGWDYVTVDSAGHRLFVTRVTHTMAVDTRTGKVLADIPGQIHSHGVALVPRLNRGFITDGGGSGAIVVFNMKTYEVLGRIPAMPDADGIIYDEKLDRVLAVSGDGNALMVFPPNINPETDKIGPPINLGGAPEFLASDGTGKVYVNLVNEGVVAVVDLNRRKVVARWPVAPGGEPTAMALDPKDHVLFIGCRNPKRLIVMSTIDGKVKAALPLGAVVDAASTGGNQVFASCGDGTLYVAGKKAGKFKVEQVVKTAHRARTMGFDAGTHQIFLAAGRIERESSGRRHVVPGTFEIVVVGEH